ncbi:hypothetical protein BD289DRAFT_361129 [Coniella lustricola]|uniref:C2H2-type domain-containing protein n=1 Tax=Coniella lustricola TaxID=2025994 RepID=A0A2T3AIT3_9PEZI|nr:hypothetical protein BD289DRAFT_361129 [Coniella lustricola]
MSADDSFASDVYHGTYAGGDDRGVWAHESSDRLGGWDPHHRPVDEGVSVNEMDALRRTTERNDNVNDWVTMLGDGQLPPNHPPPPSFAISEAQSDGIDPREISLGDQTENVPLPDQIYYTEANGPLVEEDFALMRAPRTWADAPAIYPITKKNAERQQPETSQAAIARFDQMCQDTGSVLSRAATWGTRRRSLPSIAEIDGITSGNFLKKLSITRDRKPSILLKELCGRIAKPNAPPKRNLTCPEGELASEIHVPSQVQHRATLQLGSRSPSWTKRSPSSLNTALLSMGTSAASIATQHARTGSISTVASPKSPFLGVRIPLRRPRSKSELSKNTTVTDEESNSYTHSNLAELWKKSGGPPVAQLRTRHTTTDFDDEDDEDDDVHDDGELRAESNNIIDEVTPKVAGFKEQILKMNPSLAEHNTFLVDRIAYQQVARYKMLLGHRLRHLQQIAARSCPSRHMCIALGGSAIHYNTSREPHGASSATMTLEDDQGDATQVEGAITAESFPVDIPMPPATSMPAEFECQLCYSTKKFAKPSDWTKHVHEDVQPFTCTWDRCREPKIFKRKADWVRHENEGHRHLEWWTCDVEDCRHTCYRRDNFLQHLVREHKFLEPKVKTKAALKRAGAQDPTWQKVEKCHKETTARPQDEPCRFCGKVLLTWKKLTVHLAKHMEALSLPLLRMVANRDLETDTIISPIQDPPPRTFPPLIPEVQQPLSTSPSPGQSSALGNSSSVKLDYSNSQQPYSYDTSSNFAPYYSAQVHELQQSSNVNFAGPSTFQPTSAYQDLPVTASSYMPSQPYMTVPPHVEPFPAYIGALHLQTENPLYDMTSMDARSAPTIGVEHQQYQSQGSASPYIQSPPQGQGGFFHQQR